MIEVPDGLRITVADTSGAGYCPRGVKGWFAAHNLDYRDFLANGISAEDFLATGDGQAIRVVERVIERMSQAAARG